jgi:hypothetical protein
MEWLHKELADCNGAVVARRQTSASRLATLRLDRSWRNRHSQARAFSRLLETLSQFRSLTRWRALISGKRRKAMKRGSRGLPR